MKLGIVGSEARKFTPYTQEAARRIIRSLIQQTGADLVISGHSPLGGIDWWAIEEAKALGVATQEYPAATNRWHDGFKQRNKKIAQESDMVVCITLKELPPGFRGMRFPSCYHHDPPATDHVKSGGCWTVKEARRLGKHTGVLIIDPPEATTADDNHY